MSTATPKSPRVVNRKVISDAEYEKRLKRYEALDQRGRAYYGFWEYSPLSADAMALFGYLKSKQGLKTHAFPSFEQIHARFGWWKHRVLNARRELQEVLGKDVFRFERGKGNQRNSYSILDFRLWPESVCSKMWFGEEQQGAITAPCHSAITAPCDGHEGAIIAPQYGYKHGESLDGHYTPVTSTKLESGSRRRPPRPSRFCEKCGAGGAQCEVAPGVWVCREYEQCWRDYQNDRKADRYEELPF